MRGSHRMHRPCTKCEKRFIPQTKHTRLCDKCHEEASGRGGKRKVCEVDKNKKKTI